MKLKSRTRVLLNREKDPFDTFDLLKKYQEQYKSKAKYFF